MTLGRALTLICIGLFPVFSLLSHGCVANIRKEADRSKTLVVATVHIEDGEQILTSYKNPLLSSVSRRAHFPRIWYFDCECRRCCDPTELGSHTSTIRCLLPDVPGDDGALPPPVLPLPLPV